MVVRNQSSLRLVETSITVSLVAMRYADDPDPARAVQWFDLCVPLSALDHPMKPDEPIQETDNLTIAAVRLAALRYLQNVVVAETEHLQELIGI